MDRSSADQPLGIIKNHMFNTDDDAQHSEIWTTPAYSQRRGHSSKASTDFTIYSNQAPLGNVATAAEERGQRTCSSSRKHSAPAPPGLDEPANRPSEQQSGPTNPEASIGQSQKDFEMDPAHDFWKWSIERQNWYHVDETTGSWMWAPLELD